jgi:secondary thiamine-phosphate synthase enzyme
MTIYTSHVRCGMRSKILSMMQSLLAIFLLFLIRTHSFSIFSSESLRATSLTKINASNGAFSTMYRDIQIPTSKGIHLIDITKNIVELLKESGVTSGQISLVSKHTTTSLIINEMESRLVDDTRQYLAKLAPANEPYLHNDLHLRSGPKGKERMQFNSIIIIIFIIFIIFYDYDHYFGDQIGPVEMKHGEPKNLSMLTLIS